MLPKGKFGSENIIECDPMSIVPKRLDISPT